MNYGFQNYIKKFKDEPSNDRLKKIVEDIVNSHGGNIRISKSEMGGLMIRISLPF